MSFKIILGISCCCDMNLSESCNCGKVKDNYDGNFIRIKKLLYTGNISDCIEIYNNYIKSRDQTKQYTDLIYGINGFIELKDDKDDVILFKEINVLPLPENYECLRYIDSDSESDFDI